MLQFGLLLALLLQDFTSHGAVHLNGHDYSLFCRLVGESASNSAQICEGADHFEVRDEAGRIQFALSTPADNPFTSVNIEGGTYANTDFFRVYVSHDQVRGRDATPLWIYYEFDPRPSGLVPLDPPVACPPAGGGMGEVGATLSCDLKLGYVRMSALLKVDARDHRVEIDQSAKGYSVFSPFGQSDPKQSYESGDIQVYSNHQTDAPSSRVKIKSGHSVIWWQSRFQSSAPRGVQTIMILWAWAPVTLTPSDGIPAGAKMVSSNAKDLWLQIKVDDQAGWIHGSSSFDTVGLHIP